jgi:spore coat assembly protein SafA
LLRHIYILAVPDTPNQYWYNDRVSISGIDVSEFQGSINWQAVKGSGVAFAFIRASIGTLTTADAQFANNWANSRAAGVARAAYHFAYPSLNTAVAEASNFCNIVRAHGLQPGDVLALDLETGSGDLSAWVHGFRNIVAADLGIVPLLYASRSFFAEHNLTFTDTGGDLGLWIADWSGDGSPTAGWPFTAVHQYSNQGTVSGIAGRVDLDTFNGDVTQFLKYGIGGSKPIPPPTPAPPAPVPPQPPSGFNYTVRPGDTMWGIAVHFHVSLAALEAANPQVKNPSLIYPGEVLHIPGYVPTPTPPPAHHTYRVQPGDTFSGIANKFHIALATLEHLNPQLQRGANNWSLIYPGDLVYLN